METLSFVLGIASVVVIATAIVAVYAFVKVNRLSNYIDDLCTQIEHNQDVVYRDMNDRTDEIIRMLDSRCDKLENKLSNKK